MMEPSSPAVNDPEAGQDEFRRRYTLPFLRYVNILLAVVFIDGIVSIVLWLTGK